ncbi:MAG: rRNA maturation RNase YbeY [Thermodesulfovibrio sp.]|uniref:rRNA maturation RNase YbeY n=1 Tax=Thermodesulfovibrio sp. 1176 TaxID=3043424 RepID=UPI002482F5CC|nr:rRNA maturation RNase YbeY [Thermodesulfovibrio sp. 1176]MDI1472664.1 rRNA maturation RNase YbeY [Thermodesulfovibrio sp. 1176]MDI6714800.1 rRNA maturation RNase YbeY [Thermodesulfovibrio sp.]
MKLQVEIANRQRKIKVSLKRLSKIVRKIILILKETGQLKKCNIENFDVLTISVVLIGSKKMKETNYKYRGKKSTTDVLSFPYLETDNNLKEIYLGEILIDPLQAKIQAKHYRVSLWQELTRLLIHGILHLMGYDHEVTAYEAKKMHRMEEKILNLLKT